MPVGLAVAVGRIRSRHASWAPFARPAKPADTRRRGWVVARLHFRSRGNGVPTPRFVRVAARLLSVTCDLLLWACPGAHKPRRGPSEVRTGRRLNHPARARRPARANRALVTVADDWADYPRKHQQSGVSMAFEVAKRVVAESESTGRRPRSGVVEEVLRGDPSPRYRIRWDDGHESIYTPASGALRAEQHP